MCAKIRTLPVFEQSIRNFMQQTVVKNKSEKMDAENFEE